MGTNPYPRTITDESSGQVFIDDRYKAYEEGCKAGIREVVQSLVEKE